MKAEIENKKKKRIILIIIIVIALLGIGGYFVYDNFISDSGVNNKAKNNDNDTDNNGDPNSNDTDNNGDNADNNNGGNTNGNPQTGVSLLETDQIYVWYSYELRRSTMVALFEVAVKREIFNAPRGAGDMEYVGSFAINGNQLVLTFDKVLDISTGEWSEINPATTETYEIFDKDAFRNAEGNIFIILE